MPINRRRRVLIYKRVHIGDPNARGEFGCSDCMGQVRGYDYDAVIGIGGSSFEPRYHRIDGKITWVGVGPHRWPPIHPRGAPLVTFDRFVLFDSAGEKLKDFAPALAEYFFSKHRRFFYSDGLAEAIQRDIDKILALAETQTPYRAQPGRKLSGCVPKCPPRRPRRCRVVC